MASLDGSLDGSLLFNWVESVMESFFETFVDFIVGLTSWKVEDLEDITDFESAFWDCLILREEES
eukprot:13856273-Ditylum_brightwellii.AAC.1